MKFLCRFCCLIIVNEFEDDSGVVVVEVCRRPVEAEVEVEVMVVVVEVMVCCLPYTRYM
ncbi:hypothetical protein HanIR_Chr02g0085931 [Helianthus annuus]|nr:hypothetical protein HanIR_Chr02g0085931 [Helianthus annuus]